LLLALAFMCKHPLRRLLGVKVNLARLVRSTVTYNSWRREREFLFDLVIGTVSLLVQLFGLCDGELTFLP
jgi:hypothetical protein